MDPKDPRIGILDCSIVTPSIECFNRLVIKSSSLSHLTYHQIPQYGLSSVISSKDDAYVIFGSASNVHEKLKWHRELAKFINVQLLNNKPVLGICFGHQLMADFYGCQVHAVQNLHEKGHQGIRELNIMANKFNLSLGPRNLIVSHHYEVEEINDQFEVIATSAECRFDGIQHKSLPFVGLQSHPEASRAFIKHNVSATLNENDIRLGLDQGLVLLLDYFQFVKNFLTNC